MRGLSDNFRGALYMTVAMASFAINDMITKAFSGEMEIGQFLAVRGVFAIALVTALAWWMGQLRQWRSAFQPLMALRALGEMIATYFFLKALFHIPLASLSAIMQALPLALTLFAALLFGEKVGWRRLTAIAIGFGGVLIIVQPGSDSFSIFTVYALAAVGGCVLRDLATRKLASNIPSLYVTLVTTCAIMAMGGAMSLGENWQPIKGWHLFLMLASSIFIVSGYFYAVVSMRIGEIGFVSPFRYSVLLFNIIGAAIIYSEFPDFATLIGAAIVVATGVYTIYRERMVRRQAIVDAPINS